MLRNKESKGIDFLKLNDGIKIGVNILRLLYFLIIIMFVYIGILVLSKLNVLSFCIDLLKVISPIFIGLVVAWLFDPLVTRLENKNVNRVLGTIFVYFVLIVFLIVFSSLTFPLISDQLNDLASQTPGFVSYLKEGIDGLIDGISKTIGYNLTDTKLELYNIINGIGSSITTKLPNLLVNIISNIFKGGVNLLFGFIVGLYMLFDFKSIRKHFMSLIPKKYKNDTNELLDELNGNLKGYVNGTLLIMSILFVCQAIGLSLAGLKASLVFALFCAITNIIPYVGPYIGGIPTVLVGFSVSPLTGILCLISVVVCQLVESYFLQPVVMGKTMKLHPVTIMGGLLIFGHFFGILGMIFATPIIAIFKTIFKYFDKKYDIIGMITTE